MQRMTLKDRPTLAEARSDLLCPRRVAGEKHVGEVEVETPWDE